MDKATRRRARAKAGAGLLVALGALAACAPLDPPSFLGYEDAAASFGIDAPDTRGVCLVDLDADGDLDLLFTRAAGPLLFVNGGAGSFVEESRERGLPGPAEWLGCGAADLDEDGDEDLLLTDHDGPSMLLWNDGLGGFIDGTADAGLGASKQQGSVVMHDLDRDGHLDLVLPGVAAGETRAYRGLGGGRFEDLSAPLGLPTLERSWSAAAFDANNDGLPDLFLTTDVADNTGTDSEDRFLLNGGGFTFLDVTREFEISDATDGMGVAVADVNQDSFLDFFVTNIGPHYLWRNLAGGVFLNAAAAARIENGGGRVGWGTFFFDADEDGTLDLFVANGGYYRRGTTEPLHDGTDPSNRLFVQGRAGDDFPRFVDAAPRLGLADDAPSLGAAWGDLDGDGFIDVVVANQEGARAIVRRGLGHGASEDPGALRLRLLGTSSPTEALGAHVVADICGTPQLRTLGTGPSVFSQGERIVHLALGGCREDVLVSVGWPNGGVEDFVVPVRGRQVVTLVEGAGD